MKCTKITEMPELFVECGNPIKQPSYAFTKDSCYQGGKYFGKVIFRDNSTIKVECKNGNKYMEGQIIEFKFAAK